MALDRSYMAIGLGGLFQGYSIDLIGESKMFVLNLFNQVVMLALMDYSKFSLLSIMIF